MSEMCKESEVASKDCDCDGLQCVSGQVCTRSDSGATCEAPCPNTDLRHNVNTSDSLVYLPGGHLFDCKDGYYVDGTKV